jgi:hypothetical protein
MEMKMPFFYKKREQEGKTDPVLGGVLVGGEDLRKGGQRMNMVEIFCTRVCK